MSNIVSRLTFVVGELIEHVDEFTELYKEAEAKIEDLVREEESTA